MSVTRTRAFCLAITAALLCGTGVASADTGAPQGATALSGLLQLAHSRPKTDKEKCKALNRCRYHYTKCANAIERDPNKNWNNNQRECIDPYQKCIHANFQGFDFFFHRWFNPTVLDCDKM